MKTAENQNIKLFKGAGYLLGMGMAAVGGVVVFVLSGNFVAAVAAKIPIGISMGIGLEKRFQGTDPNNRPEVQAPYEVTLKEANRILMIVIGILVFFSLYFLTTFI